MALTKRPFQNILMDDDGNSQVAQGGVADRIFGEQAIDKYDAMRRQNYFQSAFGPGSTATQRRSAGMGNLPLPTDALLPSGWKGQRGIMRSLMLGNQSQGKDTRILGGYGNPQDNPDMDTSNEFTATAQKYLPSNLLEMLRKRFLR